MRDNQCNAMRCYEIVNIFTTRITLSTRTVLCGTFGDRLELHAVYVKWMTLEIILHACDNLKLKLPVLGKVSS